MREWESSAKNVIAGQETEVYSRSCVGLRAWGERGAMAMNGRTSRGLALGMAALLGALGASRAQSPLPDPTSALRENLYEEGIRTCDQGEWQRALPIHERLTVLDPDYGFGWMCLGWSRQYTGDPVGAIGAYERSLTLGGMPRARVRRQMAECYSEQGKLDEALKQLSLAVDSGLPNLAGLRKLGSLEALRTSSSHADRFRELINDVDVSKSTRDQGWRTDLRILKKEARRMLFDAVRVLAEVKFDDGIAELETRIGSSSDAELEVGVMRLVARLRDGHTEARPAEGRQVPVLFGRFEDGWYISGARKENQDLVWSRIEAIEGKSPDELMAAVTPLVSRDNSMRIVSRAPFFMRTPRVLHALGASSRADELGLTVSCPDGRRRDVVVPVAEPIAEIVRVPPGGKEALPIHLKRRTEMYWFERLSDVPIVYCQYNECAEMENRPLDTFSNELIAAVEKPEVKALIVDLRWNGGGDMFTSRPLIGALLRCAKLNRPGALYVIAGRNTFSAAMLFATQLERYTPAIFVGEPTGAPPNFVGETNPETLPYSKMEVNFSNLYWQTSTAQDYRTWISPKIRTPMTFQMWKQGRDESVEAIVEYVKSLK